MPDNHPEPPFEGGSQPVPQVKEPVPGPGATAGQVITLVLCVVVIAAVAYFIFGR